MRRVLLASLWILSIAFWRWFSSFPDGDDDDVDVDVNSDKRYTGHTQLQLQFVIETGINECGKRVEQTINKFQLIVDIVMTMLWSAKMK